MKKTILYIIDSLERGGAEVMLVSTLKEIREHYHIIIVTLLPENVFTKEELICDKMFCLNMQSKKNIFGSAQKLKKIIHENNIDIVHSTLYWSVIVARLACSKKDLMVFSLATIMSTGVYRHKWYSGYTKLLDKLTYKKRHALISPTREVLNDFDNSIGVKGKKIVLYNFVKDEFFNNAIEYKVPSQKIKLVAVGNLKNVKNYQLIIDAFKLLKNYTISIDIYGEGANREFLQKQIASFDLPVKLMGLHEKIYEVLPLYDGFVMCSLLEGFGISAAEAMTIGLPLLLSDIKVFHEVSQENALFFDPYEPESLASLIKKLVEEPSDLKILSEKGKLISKENYAKEKYTKGLLKFYNEILN